VMYN